MLYVDLLLNLALLVALSVVSGFIDRRWSRHTRFGIVIQGLLFGTVALIGMLRPLVLAPGLIFDGRSVVISLAGLFFGPLAALTAALPALALRLYIGGIGLPMGLSVILASAAIGSLVHLRRHSLAGKTPGTRELYLFGLLVHAVMVALMFTLPVEAAWNSLRNMAPAVMLFYPLATILAGRILADQQDTVSSLAELHESQARVRDIIDKAPFGAHFYRLEADGRLVFTGANQQAQAILDFDHGALVGKTIEEAFPDLLKTEIPQAYRWVAAGGGVFNTERVDYRHGEINGAFEVSAFQIGSNRMAAFFRDITERKLAEAERSRSESRLQSLVRILMFPKSDVQGFLDYALEEALQLTGSKLGYIYHYDEEARQFVLNTWSREVMKECSIAQPKDCYELDRTGIWGEAVRQRREIVVNDFNAEHKLKRGYPEGHAELFRFMTVPVFSEDRIVAVIGVANKESEYDRTDVLQLQFLMTAVWREVERRRVVEELHSIEWLLSPPADREEAEKKNLSGQAVCPDPSNLIANSVGADMLAGICADHLDLLGTASVICEAEGKISFSSFVSSWCRLLAEHEEAERGPSCRGACFLPACRQAVEQGEAVEMKCFGGLNLLAVPVKAYNTICGAIALAWGDPPRDQAQLWKISRERGVDYEELLQAAVAYQSRPPYIIAMAKRRLAESGRLIGLLVERRQAEEERVQLEVQLLHSQKMEAVGLLAGGVAHDFNNMLSVILGHVELALLQVNPEDGIHKYLREIETAGRRSADLTRQLLAFARRQTIAPRVLDLNQALAGMLKMLQRLIGEDIELSWLPAPVLGLVKMDASQLDQVLTNLVVNARAALSEGGRVTIETANAEFDEEYCRGHQDYSPGRYVMVAVSDNGRGMDRDTLDRIFEPFFTTREFGQGTGLGLATVYGIIRQNQGFINVYSEPGRGSTFKIYLPQCQEEQADDQVLTETKKHAKGTEMVLLVEDQPELLQLEKEMLELLGYRVLSSAVPEEAVSLAAAYQGGIDLLMTDVIMPGMNGRALAGRLREIKPGIKVLYMSGYTANVIVHHGVLDDKVAFLQKPFSLSELAEKIRLVIECREKGCPE